MADGIEPIVPHPSGNSLVLPPLRIHHLMAWMAVTALLISACMWFDRTARHGPPITDRVVIASLVVGAIAIAASFTGLAFGLYWRGRGHDFPRQPGDLLLTIAATSALFIVGVIAGIFTIFFIFGDDDWQPAYYSFAMLLALIGWARINARGFARYADTTAWRIFYAMMIVAPGIVLVTTLAGIWTVAPLGALIACLIATAGNDLRNRLQRHWTHWLGVVVAILLIAALIGLDRW
jgi:hypothetical protein